MYQSQLELNTGEFPSVVVYTDGGCDPNPGPGGWGAIIRGDGWEWTLSGGDPHTTNNRMEMHAAAAALALLDGLLGRCQVEIYTDSQYLRQGITEWIDDWAGRDWRTADKRPVQNQDLWRTLHRLSQAHDVTWRWLKGHAGHPLNERADRLATAARRALPAPSEPPTAGLPLPQDGSDLPAVEVFVKSSYRGREQRGGWGAVLRLSGMGEHTRSLSGSETETSANALLIRGATEALRALTRPCRVTVYSDANYLIRGASQWMKGWQAHGWRTKDGQPVANREAWEALIEAARPHQITWVQTTTEAPADLTLAGAVAVEAAQTRNTKGNTKHEEEHETRNTKQEGGHETRRGTRNTKRNTKEIKI
jgi:ribonuclease HI